MAEETSGMPRNQLSRTAIPSSVLRALTISNPMTINTDARPALKATIRVNPSRIR